MEADRQSSTALGVALVRAHLTDVGLLDDSYAVGFLDERNRRRLGLLRRRPFRRIARGRSLRWLAARILCFDDAVARSLDGGVTQVVVLGAGYDSRAWRFARPGVRFWEVDQPSTQAEKRRRAPAGGPSYLALDLVAEPVATRLVEAGLDPALPTAFVAEGLVMYLADDELHALLDGLRPAAAPGSRLAFNIGVGFEGGASVVRQIGRRLLARSHEPVRSTLTPDTVGPLLASAGWSMVKMVVGPEAGRRHLAGTGLRTDDLNPGSAVVVAEPRPEASRR